MSQNVLAVWTITSRRVHVKADYVLDAEELEVAMVEAVTTLGFARRKEFDAGFELAREELGEGGLEGLRRDVYSTFVTTLRASGHGDALVRDAFSRAYVTLYVFEAREG